LHLLSYHSLSLIPYHFLIFFFIILPPPTSSLFPYTTLFRSCWSSLAGSEGSPLQLQVLLESRLARLRGCVRCSLTWRSGLGAVVVVNPPTGDFAVLADVVDVFPVCNRSFVPLAQVTVGAGQGQAGRSRSRRGCGVEVESNVSEHALTKKVSAIAVMAAPLRTVLKTMTWPGSYK